MKIIYDLLRLPAVRHDQCSDQSGLACAFLSPYSRGQVEELRKRFQESRFYPELIISSPLTRALRTTDGAFRDSSVRLLALLRLHFNEPYFDS